MEEVINNIYILLCNKQYTEIARLTNNTRCPSNEIQKAILEYRCHLVPYPDDVIFDIIEVTKSSPREVSVWAPIYTKEEGLSDLSFELSLIEVSENNFKVEFDNIHVH